MVIILNVKGKLHEFNNVSSVGVLLDKVFIYLDDHVPFDVNQDRLVTFPSADIKYISCYS